MPGPLVARWESWQLPAACAGAPAIAHARVVNAGAAAWGVDVLASYHWLDGLGNPIVWDGVRTALPGPVASGAAVDLDVRVRAPMPPGRYRFALDLVAEGRAWFAELGSDSPSWEVDVRPRVQAAELAAVADVHLPNGCEPAPGWEDDVLAAHAEGYAVVAGAIEAPRRLRRALAAWAPGPGRVPSFPSPLLCPSILRGVEVERLPDVEGLPAFAPPRDEPWVYDGRLVIRWRR